MPERRSPRRLNDVAHLFLSGAGTASHGAPRSPAGIWIAAAGASMNRAHFAAGMAAAFARQGVCVSLLELCDNLPNCGYYFGMEPPGYLGPAIDRTSLVSGTWNGAVRYCLSANLASFERYRGEALPIAAPHAIVVAFSYLHEREPGGLLAALQGAAAVLTESGERTCPPDAIIAAGCGALARRARTLAMGMRETFPQTAIFLVTDDRRTGLASEADENFTLPRDFRLSWARRVPPVDRFFGELAAGLLQVISQRHRRGAGHAANG